ncbi:MAG: tetratricopeptide repeat protein [Rhodospirillales bacterium]|nr:tetratricopeptide repeat protein [Rhodospirillales bacterium]
MPPKPATLPAKDAGGSPPPAAGSKAPRKPTLAEVFRKLFGIPSPEERVNIRVAPLLGDDESRTATRRVAGLYAANKRFPVRVAAKPFPSEGALPTPLQFSLFAPLARQFLATEKGDLLIFGEVAGDRLHLRFVPLLAPEEDAPDALSAGIPLVVPAEMDEDASALIRAVALTVVAPGQPLKAATARESLAAAIEPAVAAMEALKRALAGRDKGFTLLVFASAAARAGYAQSAPPLLQKAIDFYRAAVESLARDKDSYEGATAQRLLGSELLALAERNNDKAALAAAHAALQAAAQTLPRETAPRDWAAVQHRLGIAFQRMHEETSSVEPLKQALTAFQAALHVFTRAEHPQRWADIMNSIGQSGQLLGQILSSTEIMERAVAACRQAIEIRRKDTHPLFWAASQNNLGSALFALGRMTGSLESLIEAEEAFAGAREVYFARGADKLASVAEKNLTRVRQLLPATRAKAADGPKHWHEIDDEEEWKKMKGDKSKG